MDWVLSTTVVVSGSSENATAAIIIIARAATPIPINMAWFFGLVVLIGFGSWSNGFSSWIGFSSNRLTSGAGVFFSVGGFFPKCFSDNFLT